MDIFSPRHLIILLLLALVIFGTKKLRTIGSDLGTAVRGFKDSMREAEQATSSEPSSTPQDAKQIANSEKPAEKVAEKAASTAEKATHA